MDNEYRMKCSREQHRCWRCQEWIVTSSSDSYEVEDFLITNKDIEDSFARMLLPGGGTRPGRHREIRYIHLKCAAKFIHIQSAKEQKPDLKGTKLITKVLNIL